jgi:putative SOS response-associated peptidase YedK
MCGRFTLTIAERRMVAEMLGVDQDSIPEDYAAGTTSRRQIPIASSHRDMSSGPLLGRWGLVNSWARDNSRAAANDSIARTAV